MAPSPASIFILFLFVSFLFQLGYLTCYLAPPSILLFQLTKGADRMFLGLSIISYSLCSYFCFCFCSSICSSSSFSSSSLSSSFPSSFFFSSSSFSSSFSYRRSLIHQVNPLSDPQVRGTNQPAINTSTSHPCPRLVPPAQCHLSFSDLPV